MHFGLAWRGTVLLNHRDLVSQIERLIGSRKDANMRFHADDMNVFNAALPEDVMKIPISFPG